jgi:hypothetical protein
VLDMHRHILTEHLSDGSPYDAAGPFVYSEKDGGPMRWPLHFSGNFWAAKCSHINTLPRISDVGAAGDRMQAEYWVGKGGEGVLKDCLSMYANECVPSMYTCELPESAYESVTRCG